MNSILPPFSPSDLEGRTRNTPLRVLIVDDHQDNRLLLKLFLKKRGVETLEAANGKEAIEMACDKCPHLILMDLNMPIMDGFEATRQLTQMPATRLIPIVAVSALCNDPIQDKKAIDAGCIYCLGKPVVLKKLQMILDTL
ncbi:MAG: response regulator [Proteobacteria bacterium]|nr:MAG: response regulator [Pseudomonadota bacterium]